MIAQYLMVDNATLDQLANTPTEARTQLLDSLSMAVTAPLVDLGKLWDVIHFVLTKHPATQPVPDAPLSEFIVGVDTFSDDPEADFIAYVPWSHIAEILDALERHVDTGETLPDHMLQGMLAAKNFQSGMQTLRQLEFALFDLLLHAAPAPDYSKLLALLDQVRQDISIMPTASYNRFANGFSHIFAGGYAAGYYSYKWAELLSADAFSKFEETGIFDKKTGQSFRDNILAKGGSQRAKDNFEAFRGREAKIDALLRHSGFVMGGLYDELLSDDTDNANTQAW